MRFGTFVPQGWKGDQNGVPVEKQWDRILDFAGLIEDAGYDSIWVYDHFHTHPVVTQESTFEAWTLMAALAAVTTRVRLGQMCTCNTYRPPSYLAKVAASIDVAVLITVTEADVQSGSGLDATDLTAKLRAGGQPDLFVTSGGVSIGDYDIVKNVLCTEGSIEVWQVRMKPGKPLAFGTLAGTPLLG